jgi:hypothetical protein
MMDADGFAGFSRRQQRMGTRGISPVPGACQSRYLKSKSGSRPAKVDHRAARPTLAKVRNCSLKRGSVHLQPVQVRHVGDHIQLLVEPCFLPGERSSWKPIR